MKTLIIDTSHERSIVAFADGFDILLNLPLPIGLQSSSYLFPTIKTGLQKLKLTSADLDAVAVAVGPGSFTGIRVGVSAAKGIAAPRGLPLIGLCSLQGFLMGGKSAALIDARIGGAYLLTPGGEPRLVLESDLPQALEGYDAIIGPNLKRFSFPNQIERAPDPAALIKHPLSSERQREGDLELIYLRETI
ncbi:MAG: tRNA (adenosine(37)-N6)-threonylcarbamoyltransferase complex dimerization subunit type 1 TsaB [Chlamydiales bacterium]|nr:tRNA (adenosine(37)-N6)-threonylcarbamoyltransferase complex dimerization subunit type 1 TsaB [Chlamydiales bacterium]